ncbi:MAG TPA: outer membrane protein assembly factor BamE [Usitatibacter sp.]|nr:outer membrane protein assembly factor BamE [Usitatibacter sp.]
MEPSRVVRQAAAAIAALLVVGACETMPPKRSDAVFAQIETGMTMDQVRERLGKPDETMPFPATRTLAWSYFYYDTWGFYSEESITFDAQGRVASKFSKRVGYGGDGRH